MSRGMPSMTALLGMLAIAGFQNRDKLIEMFNSVAGHHHPSSIAAIKRELKVVFRAA